MNTPELGKRRKLIEMLSTQNKNKSVGSCMMGQRNWLKRRMRGSRKLRSNLLSIFLCLKSKNINKFRVCEKEMERAAQLNQKLIKQEFQVKNKAIENIAEELRHQHNEYEGEKLDRKSYDVSKTLSVNRDSLRNSLLIKKRMTQITDFQSKVKIKIDHYEQLQGNLTFETMPDNDFGIFDN